MADPLKVLEDRRCRILGMVGLIDKLLKLLLTCSQALWSANPCALVLKDGYSFASTVVTLKLLWRGKTALACT